MSSFPRSRLPLLTGLACFGVYLWTLCPTVYVGDSGELTVAAYGLGIPHNSGYPLYALLGKVLCLVPFGSIGFRMSLFSALLAAATVALLHDFLLRVTSSTAASSCAALFVAFTPIFWFQAVSAEVYPLHLLFVTLTLRVVWWWDRKRELRRLMLLAFVLGLSFCNHLQTVMLAPALLFLVLCREGRALLQPRKIVLLSVLFLLPLVIYLYLPLRTEAGAVMTWGDPNTLGRFLDHVLAKAHRSGYVMNVSAAGYLGRAWDSVSGLGAGFGILLVFPLWGWVSALQPRWRVFCLLVVVLDLCYTVFLNTVSLEITPFNLPTLLVVTILSGLGFSDLLKRIRASGAVGNHFQWAAKGAIGVIPLIPLAANLGLCDQSRNYLAYEHAVNVLETAEKGSVLFIDGDNNVFPVMYARVCEGMGEELLIVDRFNLVFRWPADSSGEKPGSLSSVVEGIVRDRKGRGIHLSVFDPKAFPLPDGYRPVPHGVLARVDSGDHPPSLTQARELWRTYSTVSVSEPMGRDYMNRQVCSYFHFYRAKFLFESGRSLEALESIRTASRIGYNDEMIHSDIGVLLTRKGFYEEARRALGLALRHTVEPGTVHNNWGCYYDAVGDPANAVRSFQRAVEISPGNATFLNNLGFAFLKAGEQDQAFTAWKRSLDLVPGQEEIRKMVRASP